MRIAIYHNLTSGGAKRALYEQVKRLSSRHTCDVFTLESADHTFADIRPFAARHRVYAFKPSRLFDSPFGRLNQIIRLLDLQRLLKLHRQIATDIENGNYPVAFVNPSQMENAPSILSEIKQTPTVFYCAEPLRIAYEVMPARPYDPDSTVKRRLLNRIDPLPGLYKAAIRRNDRNNMRQARLVLVNSEYTANSVRRIYGVQSRINYLGVDTDRFHPTGDVPREILLSVGSLTPLKGFDFLINAVAEISSRQRPKLVIASNFQNRPEKSFLESMAREKSVDLILMGNVSEDQLIELYNQACLTVYAPVREPFGFVSLESQSCETPVVAVREGGMIETIVDQATGLLVERDPKQFAEAILSLLSDPNRARVFGKTGRKHVLDHWTWEQSVSALEEHLAEISSVDQRIG